MKHSLIAASVLLLCVVAVPGHSETFSFSLSSGGQTGTGTLVGVADPYTAGAFDITSGTGSFGAATLALVTPSGDTRTYYYDPAGSSGPTSRPRGGYYGYDNVLYTTGSPVDFDGLLFNVSGGNQVLNIFEQAGALFTAESAPNVQDLNPEAAAFTFAPVATTPEPDSLLLLGTGALSCVALVRRRMRYV